VLISSNNNYWISLIILCWATCNGRPILRRGLEAVGLIINLSDSDLVYCWLRTCNKSLPSVQDYINQGSFAPITTPPPSPLLYPFLPLSFSLTYPSTIIIAKNEILCTRILNGVLIGGRFRIRPKFFYIWPTRIWPTAINLWLADAKKSVRRALE